MQKNILVAIDGYFGSENAASYALVIAEALKARLFVAAVINRDVDKERIMSSIKRIEDRAKKRGVKTEIVFGEGNVVEELVRIVKEKDADLLVTSSGKRSEAKGFFKWSIPWRLMLREPCQVLIVKIVKLRPFAAHKRILVPIIRPIKVHEDLLDLVLSLATFYDAQVNFLYCPPMAPAKIAVPKYRARLDKAASEYLVPLCDRLQEKGFKADYRVGYSHDPIRTILNEAAVRHFSLTIIDARPRLLDLIIGGNPFEEALRLTTCNMIVWRAGKKHG